MAKVAAKEIDISLKGALRWHDIGDQSGQLGPPNVHPIKPIANWVEQIEARARSRRGEYSHGDTWWVGWRTMPGTEMRFERALTFLLLITIQIPQRIFLKEPESLARPS